jgi:hypothetical protein
VARPLAVLAVVSGLLAWNLSRPATKESSGGERLEVEAEEEAVEGVVGETERPERPLPLLDAGVVRTALEALREVSEKRGEAEREWRRAEERLAAAEVGRSEAKERMEGLKAEVAILEERAADAEQERARLAEEIRGLKAELAALAAAPIRRRARPLLERNPVARPPGGEEYHFEVRGDRVAYINLNALLDRLKVDARIQLRTMSAPRPIEGEVGPVGWFLLRYRMIPAGLELGGGGIGGRGLLQTSFTLSEWEVVPRQALRGETLAEALSPASDFGRAVSVLDPQRDAITLWVYPDGFTLYRQIRDWLHERGFLVAARPLPAEMPIRGSPSGSISAGQ